MNTWCGTKKCRGELTPAKGELNRTGRHSLRAWDSSRTHQMNTKILESSKLGVTCSPGLNLIMLILCFIRDCLS